MPSGQVFSLLRLLSDGEFHSGQELGNSLGVSRAAIWKMVKKIESLDLVLHSVKGRGYKLSKPLVLLDREAIRSRLSKSLRVSLFDVEILASVGSTNSYLLKRLRDKDLALPKGSVHVCLAEQQTAGKGRRGRVWQSPFGGNICLSVVKTFESGATSLEGLSLVVGIAVVKALGKVGVAGAQLKWPNDVHWQGRKLAGVLLEMSSDFSGACQVVMGIGLNVQVESLSMKSVDQPWVDLSEILASIPDRNRLAAEIVSSLVAALERFEGGGFSEFKQEWDKLDVLKGSKVELKGSFASDDGESIVGVANGVDESGGLKIETKQGVRVFYGGEVSVRKKGV